MGKQIIVRPRKTPLQKRSKQMVNDILEAATRVLATQGINSFTTNRVAEVAGVSVGSLYQYFPNKQSLLFRLQEKEMEENWRVLDAILSNTSIAPKERIFKTINVFFESEIEEIALRKGLEQAKIYFETMPEYHAHESHVIDRLVCFLNELCPTMKEDKAFNAQLILIIITCVGSRVGEQKLDSVLVQKWARACTDMICRYLNIIE